MNRPANQPAGPLGPGWVIIGLPWRGIPELRDRPRSEARAIYWRAVQAAWRRPRMWWTTAAWVAGGGLLGGMAEAWWPLSGWAGHVRFALIIVMMLTAGDLLAIGIVRRRVRAELGTHCPSCDYDLRESPNRCPECGRSVEPPQDQR